MVVMRDLDFKHCVFSEKNMYTTDKRDGLNKKRRRVAGPLCTRLGLSTGEKTK